MSSLTALKPRTKRWHLDPVSVTKISKKDQDAREPHSVSEVQESHSVFSNLNGNRHSFKQEHEQGNLTCLGGQESLQNTILNFTTTAQYTITLQSTRMGNLSPRFSTNKGTMRIREQNHMLRSLLKWTSPSWIFMIKLSTMMD